MHRNALQRGSSLHQNQHSYISYCPFNRKYFVMVLNNKDKNIAVVEDLANVLPKTINEVEDNEAASFTGFVRQALKQITHINESRFQMPWRWRHWSHFYSSTIE
jgi:hypothetical protein